MVRCVFTIYSLDEAMELLKKIFFCIKVIGIFAIIIIGAIMVWSGKKMCHIGRLMYDYGAYR